MDVAEYRANSRLYIRRNKDDAVVVVVGDFVVVIHSRSIVWTMSSKSFETHWKEGWRIFVSAEESHGVSVTLERRNLRRTGLSVVEDLSLIHI